MTVFNGNEAANYLGVSKGMLQQYRNRGNGPKFIKVGSAVRYERADIDAWNNERKIRICRHCGSKFKSDRCTAFFCSRSCEQKAAYRKASGQRECANCGKMFPVNARRKSKHCSSACAANAAALSGLGMRECKKCGVSFKGVTAIYCSPKCRIGNGPKELSFRDCAECGEPFQSYRAKICSQACHNKAFKRKSEHSLSASAHSIRMMR